MATRVMPDWTGKPQRVEIERVRAAVEKSAGAVKVELFELKLRQFN